MRGVGGGQQGQFAPGPQCKGAPKTVPDLIRFVGHIPVYLL